MFSSEKKDNEVVMIEQQRTNDEELQKSEPRWYYLRARRSPKRMMAKAIMATVTSAQIRPVVKAFAVEHERNTCIGNVVGSTTYSAGNSALHAVFHFIDSRRSASLVNFENISCCPSSMQPRDVDQTAATQTIAVIGHRVEPVAAGGVERSNTDCNENDGKEHDQLLARDLLARKSSLTSIVAVMGFFTLQILFATSDLTAACHGDPI
ncbi:hypothetical protein EJ07DRAFT_156412 [Lizonia empirigonia]|nr:hypothetical protein EJ07DRAFT_156412 [Lizonia empirigonia]